MSLQLWLPLNGNLNNIGCGDSAASQSGTFSYSQGKVTEKGIYTAAAGHIDTGWGSGIELDNISLCCWFKFSSIATNKVIFGFPNGTNQRCYLGYLSNGFCIAYGATSWNAGNGSTQTATANVWQHLCLTIENRKMSLYINGAKQGQSITLQAAPKAYGNVFLFDHNESSYRPNGTMNDFRIYDHALSQTEISRLAEGLVLDYGFQDAEVEGTTNLARPNNISNFSTESSSNTVSNSVYGGDKPFDSKCIYSKITKVTSGGWITAYGDSSIPVTPSTTYTYSFYIKTNTLFSPNFLYRREYNSSGSQVLEAGIASNDYTEDCGDGWKRYWRTFTTNANTHSITLQFVSYPGPGEYYLYYGGYQLEVKDHPTPYVNGTRSGESASDCSGFGNDGTAADGKIQIKASGDCPKGEHYAFIPGPGERMLITQNNMPLFDEMTYECWVRIDRRASSAVEIDVLTLYYGASANRQTFAIFPNSNKIRMWMAGTYKEAETDLSVGKWYHICGTVDSNRVVRVYVNGKEENVKTTVVFPEKVGNTPFCIGPVWNSSTYNADISVASARLYATALSADRIKNLYESRQKIARNGTVMGGIEEKHQPNVVLSLDDWEGKAWASQFISSSDLATKLKPSQTYYVHYIYQKLGTNTSAHTYTTQKWGGLASANGISCDINIGKDAYIAMAVGETKDMYGTLTTGASLTNPILYFYTARYSGSSSDWGSNAEVIDGRFFGFEISETPFSDSIKMERDGIISARNLREVGDKARLHKNGTITTPNFQED